MNIRSCIASLHFACNYFFFYLKNIKSFLNLKKVKVNNNSETLDYIISHHCSVSRYGDGEFQHLIQFMSGKRAVLSNCFQQYDSTLSERLYNILQEPSAKKINHIVCVPYPFFHSMRGYKYRSKEFIWGFLSLYINDILKSVNPSVTYFDTNITRFYSIRTKKANTYNNPSRLKKIWQDRNICFIEGEKSRLGVGNNLFDNAKSIKRILAPADNSYSKYDELLDIAKKQPKDTLFLLALGMTATVLAYDLAKLGYQAVDVGHVDIEYEWLLMGAKTKVPIPNKYTNEANKEGGRCPAALHDSTYDNQIIARIGC